jgi:Transposase DDE domain
VGGAGAAAARWQARAPGEVGEAAAHRRDPVAGAGRCAVAGRAAGVRAMADGVWTVPALAARWHLAGGADRAAGPGGCGRADLLGCQRRFDGGAGAPARGRGAQKGDLQAEPPGGLAAEPADHALGRSRGGLTTKTHLACEQGQKPLSVVITAGQRGDSPQFQAVLEAIRVPRPGPGRPRTRPDRVLGDKAYGSAGNRAYLRRRGIRCTIPQKADQVRNRKNKGRNGGRPPKFDPEIQAAPRRRMRHRPAQAQPRRRHPLRQTRRPLRSHRQHRRHQRVAAPLMKHDLVETRPLMNDGSGILSPESLPRPGEVALLTAIDAVLEVPVAELPDQVALVRRYVGAALEAVPGTRRVTFQVIAQMLVRDASRDCSGQARDQGS